ncbi:MAG: hypothetical protein QF521_06145 [Alphaproteobacteria bacterium]|nr:hypothetical protein [Alphaproteobacteria bacterium]MDP6873088.1 hypothetical protein [Alphaproteobacteria bacterium]
MKDQGTQFSIGIACNSRLCPGPIFGLVFAISADSLDARHAGFPKGLIQVLCSILGAILDAVKIFENTLGFRIDGIS